MTYQQISTVIIQCFFQNGWVAEVPVFFPYFVRCQKRWLRIDLVDGLCFASLCGGSGPTRYGKMWEDAEIWPRWIPSNTVCFAFEGRDGSPWHTSYSKSCFGQRIHKIKQQVDTEKVAVWSAVLGRRHVWRGFATSIDLGSEWNLHLMSGYDQSQWSFKRCSMCVRLETWCMLCCFAMLRGCHQSICSFCFHTGWP